jgi:predicted PurR-regulated permease PerM
MRDGAEATSGQGISKEATVLGSIVMLVGAVVGLVGWIMVVIAGFKTSVLWGILCLIGPLLLGIPLLIFLIMHWGAAKKGFFVWLVGFAIQILGALLGGGAAMTQMPNMGT